MKLIRRITIFLGLLGSAYAQTTIVNYTFENTTVATVGSSLSSISWNSGASPGYAGTFTSQGQALSIGNMASGNSFQITLNASGFENIVLNDFRINGTAAAPLTWQLSYSLTGAAGTFTGVSPFTLNSGISAGVTTVTGFALPAGANNNGSIVISFLATTATKISGTGSASGTLHLDNLSFTATAIPEPATYSVLIAAITLGFILFQRIRRRSSGPPL
ncbi:MAG: hypothetical protein H7343_22325 [Undibacterium sp.]|nr:hypothetical protein [Opitutaceae bacterium]